MIFLPPPCAERVGPALVAETDCFEFVAGLPGSCVDSIVTSPPYADARRDVAAPAPDDYEEWIAPLLEELLRVVRPTGSLMLSLGRCFRDGEELEYTMDVVRRARRIGWRWVETIVWSKPNANAISGNVLLNAHEYVYWFARDRGFYRGVDEVRAPYKESSLKRLNRAFRSHGGVKMDGRQFERMNRRPHPLGAKPRTIVEFSVGRIKGLRHPTPMPLGLARHLVALATVPAGIVLDPFAGCGTTLLAALELDRAAIGVDHDPGACWEALERLRGYTGTQLTLEAA